jgi:transposase
LNSLTDIDRYTSTTPRLKLEQPGRNVRAKAGLNRGILDAAWGEFARQLAYKVQWRRGRVDQRAISAESLLAPKDRIATP